MSCPGINGVCVGPRRTGRNSPNLEPGVLCGECVNSSEPPSPTSSSTRPGPGPGPMISDHLRGT